MRLPLPTRLFELFALLLSTALCLGFIVGGLVSDDHGALIVGLAFIGPTYAAGRVMLRDWKRQEPV